MRDVDVMIVGAGPSGCAAAYDLAAGGLSVLLLDKQDFPRNKPCAGGLTIKTLQALRYPVTPVIQRVTNNMLVGLKLDKAQLFQAGGPVTAMTVRAELDDYCLRQCTTSGVAFQRIGPITSIKREATGWSLVTDQQTFQARWLIGADGANSRVRRLLMPKNHVTYAMAAEACIPVADPGLFEMEMDFHYVPKGYAWIFPKADHLNIGIYSLESVPKIKTRLIAYCSERLGTQLDPKQIIGHRIPVNGFRYRHQKDDVMLVGDAAGLADPLCGEGLYNAIRSGQIAARNVLDQVAGNTDSYAHGIGEITADLGSYHSYTRLFYRFPRLGYRLLCFPLVRYSLMKGFALGWTVGRILWRFPLLPFYRPPRTPLQPDRTADS